MANDSKDSIAVPPAVLVALAAVLLGGFAAHQLPLEDTRPAVISTLVYRHVPPDDQDVEARLWEDPLGAVAAASAHHPAHPSVDVRHSIQGLAATVAAHVEHGSHILVIAALVPGAPYAEDIETRRRTRYAVLAGLSQQFTAQNSEHVGYVNLKEFYATAEFTPAIAAYEWFQRDEPMVDPRVAPRVLLLWLDQDGFRSTPLATISRIITKIAPSASADQVRSLILGPADSDGLEDMTAELQRSIPGTVNADHSCDSLRPIDIYSPRATASDAIVMEGARRRVPARQAQQAQQAQQEQPEQQAQSAPPTLALADFFANRSGERIHLYRTVVTDDLLVDDLIKELRYRGVENPGQIALIAERDTLYASQMRHYFRNGNDQNPDPRIEPLVFTYLRGLDGLAPPAASDSTPDPSTDTHTANSQSDALPVASDVSTGEGQLDYLRRLAKSLATLPLDTAGNSHRIKAIGVLGTDLYDKLLVLQALRSSFPWATFFTTDLDARLLDAQNLPVTRQLLVASSLGLSLHPNLQGDIPPFRDTYQSSTYFSTRLALLRFESALSSTGQASSAAAGVFGTPGVGPAYAASAQVDPPCGPDTTRQALCWTKTPRIFEIGRGRPLDLTPDHQGDLGCLQGRPCRSISVPQPAPLSHSSWNGFVAGTGAATALIFVAWFAMGPRWLLKLLVVRHNRRGRIVRRRRRRQLFAFLCVGTVIAGFTASWSSAIDLITNGGRRVPPPLFGGTNHWSAGLFEAIAALAVVALVVRGQRKLGRNADDLRERFELPTDRHTLVKTRARVVRAWPLARRWKEYYLFALMRLSADRGRLAPPEGRSEIEELIAWYLFRGAASGRVKRVLPMALGVTLVLVWMEQLLLGRKFLGALHALVDGWPQNVAMSWISLVSLFAMTFLILWVIDAMLLSRAFLLEVLRFKPQWPPTSIQKIGTDLGLTSDRAVVWLDLKLVADRTAWVSGLIWYPSIVMVLMGIAAFTVEFGQFGYANNPAALVASLALVIGVAVMLRGAAERMRRSALMQIDNAHLRALGSKPSEGRSEDQLASLREWVAALSEGAFAPFSAQPFVKGVLLPVSTYGATVILSYFHIAS
jgi:hypothetical protein